MTGLNQVRRRDCDTVRIPNNVEELETNDVVGRWNRTLKEQALYGRVFRNLADIRAVTEFVDRYNHYWCLEKLAYRTPLEAREEYELRHAA